MNVYDRAGGGKHERTGEVIFSRKKKQCEVPVEQEGKVEKSPEIKGYMFVFQHERSKELEIQLYLDGRKDEEMQKQASRPGFKIAQRVYSTLETLLEDKKGPGNHPRTEGSCYVLYLNCSAVAAYMLIEQGNFHMAIAGHKSFHEILYDSQNANAGQKRIRK